MSALPPATPLPSLERFALTVAPIRSEGPSVILVAWGEVLVREGEELVRARPGDLVSVAPGACASLRAARGSARVESLRADRRWLDAALALSGSAPGPDGASFLVDRRGTDRARLGERLLREVAGELPAGDACGLRRAARCVELVAMTLAARPSPLSEGAPARASDRRAGFLRALEDLGEEPLEEVSLCSFAHRTGLSERHVSRLCQLELGRSFREHLAGLRLERAKALLRDTRMSVVAVAGETGWSSLAHFNAVFRKRVGATPSHFRSVCEDRARRLPCDGADPDGERELAPPLSERGEGGGQHPLAERLGVRLARAAAARERMGGREEARVEQEEGLPVAPLDAAGELEVLDEMDVGGDQAAHLLR